MATLTPQAFAKRWGESALSERSSYQQHFLDLCEMLGAPKPAETDPAGEFYTFEKGVEKTGSGKGFQPSGQPPKARAREGQAKEALRRARAALLS